MKFNMSICMSLLVVAAPFYTFSEQPAQPTELISLKAQGLDEERIEHFKATITAELARNTDIRTAAKGICYAGGTAIALLACYKLIKDLSIIHHDELLEMKRQVFVLQAMAASQVFQGNDAVQAAAAGLVGTADSSGFISTWTCGGSTIVRFVGQTALSSFIAHIAQKFAS